MALEIAGAYQIEKENEFRGNLWNFAKLLRLFLRSDALLQFQQS